MCRNQDCHSLLLLPIHIARQMASSTLCCNSLIAQIVKLALLQKSGYSVHDSFCAKVIFHLQFKARTSVCPQMCVYIFQPRHCFFVSVGEFRILFSSLLVPVREQHVSCFINNRPIFVKQEFLIAITCAGQDKVSEYFQLKGFLSWTIQDFSVQVSVSGRKNLLDIFPFHG